MSIKTPSPKTYRLYFPKVREYRPIHILILLIEPKKGPLILGHPQMVEDVNLYFKVVSVGPQACQPGRWPLIRGLGV